MPSKEVTISVIMSVYNHQDYVSDAIESILNQTFSDFEFIIINDGSTDGSLDVIQKYSQLDSRIIIIDQDNIGLTKSLNIGIKNSSGQYIARQDADDTSEPVRLEQQLRTLKEHQLDFVTSRAIRQGKVVPNSFVLNFNRIDILRTGNIFVHGTFLFNRRVLDVQQYNEDYKYAQDFKFVLDAFDHNLSVGYMLNPLYRLNSVVDSISNTQTSEQDRFVSLALKEFFGSNVCFLRISKCRKILGSVCRLVFILYLHTSSKGNSFKVIRS